MTEYAPPNDIMRAIENRIHYIREEDPNRGSEEIRREILNFLMADNEPSE